MMGGTSSEDASHLSRTQLLSDDSVSFSCKLIHETIAKNLATPTQELSDAWYHAEARRHLRARLDALYFHLYGLSHDDAGYVLDTFPIVSRQDEAGFGRYRTRDLVLAYMNALAAGDTETVMSAQGRHRLAAAVHPHAEHQVGGHRRLPIRLSD